tara:strand:- start:163 stop:390 length:228 start_codon:yes stop_codon:yes gene_type:complete
LDNNWEMEIMNFKLDKNIKLPSRSKYSAADNAEVGDSMLVENRNQARAVQRKMRDHGWTAATRKVEKGFRVWRTG